MALLLQGFSLSVEVRPTPGTSFKLAAGFWGLFLTVARLVFPFGAESEPLVADPGIRIHMEVHASGDSHYGSLLREEEYLIQNYTVEDGLPVNSIGQIVQDENGYLWFSSLGGLIRYDGYQFRIYNSGNTEGMYSNRIQKIINTGSNEIWLFNVEQTVTRKSGSVFTTFGGSFGNLQGRTKAVKGIIQAGDGRVWIRTDTGIAVFNRATEAFDFVGEPLLQSDSFGIESAFAGGIITANQNGLILWKDGRASVLIDEKNFPLPAMRDVNIHQFNPDEIWVTGIGGFFRYSFSKRSVDYEHHFPGPFYPVLNLYPEKDGNFIIIGITDFYSLDAEKATLSKLETNALPVMDRMNITLRGLNDELNTVTKNNVRINGQQILDVQGIRSALVDREGALWISTSANGIFQILKSDFLNLTPGDIPGFQNIYPVIQSSDGAIWAGSFENGIYRLTEDSVTNWNMENSQLDSRRCRFLFEDSDGTLYAGLWRTGLWVFTNNEWEKIDIVETLIRPNSVVEAMYRDSKNRLFIGTRGPLLVYQNEEYTVFDESSGNALRGVRVLRENSWETLFMGTEGNGLTILSGDRVANYTTGNSDLTSDFIRDIYVQSSDTLWLATQDKGLNRVILNDDGVPASIVSITEQDGLIQNSLHRIIESLDRHLWISSNGGIMRISKDVLNRYADGQQDELIVLGFDERDGMSNREANGGVQTAGFLSADQKLWFPNQNGITVIDPAQKMLPLPRPVIEEMAFSGSFLQVDDQSEIRIPTGQRNLRIKFSAPNFSFPDRMQFRYKLEGINQNWENGNQSREAVLTNIPPGTHEFQMAVYRTGNAAEFAEASILITIPFFFYETILFKIFLALLGVLALFGGIKFRTRVLEHRERKLQERVNRQTIELQQAAEQKSRFFSGITHELKTPLSLILSPLEDLMENPIKISEETVQNRLRLMYRNGMQLKTLVDQILDVTKLNADAVRFSVKPVQIVELTRQIAGQFHSKLEMKEISLIIEADVIEEPVYVDTAAWEHIVINLFSNAIRFSPRGSSIHVTIRDLGERVCLRVKDEGPGIDKKEQEKVFEYLYQGGGSEAAEGTGIGLYLVKGLVERMRGHVELMSKKGEGAEFTVVLQKGYAHFSDSDTVLLEIPDAFSAGVRKDVPTVPIPAEQKATGHIMIVEDNDDYRNYLRSILSETYRVETASEGSEALEILKETSVDLVISDVMMPGMNGLEFVDALRKKDDYKHLPVIFLSAKNREMDVESGLSTGADIYLTKPIKSTLLLSQIAAVLRRERILASNQIKGESRKEAPFVRQVRTIVYRQLSNPSLNIDMLADSLFMSRATLYREWKKVSEITLNDFIKLVRLNEAKTLLKEQGFGVRNAAMAVGYPDSNYFSTSFKKVFGVNPSEVLK